MPYSQNVREREMDRRKYEARKRRRRKRRRQQFMARSIVVLTAMLIVVVAGYGMYRLITGGAAVQEAGVPVAEVKYVDERPELLVELLDYNEYSRPGTALEQVNGIVVHYTANPGTTAEQNRSYFENLAETGETYASSHFVIGLSGEIVQCIPCNEIAYASNERNADTISIECCIPDDTGRFADATYDSLVKLVTWLMGRYGLTEDDVISILPEVIESLATYDITTIRASIGMYLLCRYIHRHTDVRVLLTGEVSDELFGYKYTDFAPDSDAFEKESQKRVRELYAYDVLRADRCIADNSIEARVPFGDLDFASYVLSIDPEMKMNRTGHGKYLLRKAFDDGTWLPDDILWREKAAFSDAVGHSMVDDLKAYAERYFEGRDLEAEYMKYPEQGRPFTPESLLYREIFERFYPGQYRMIPGFWMPNSTWPGCNVNDPSARVLSNYGKSGE